MSEMHVQAQLTSPHALKWSGREMRVFCMSAQPRSSRPLTHCPKVGDQHKSGNTGPCYLAGLLLPVRPSPGPG